MSENQEKHQITPQPLKLLKLLNPEERKILFREIPIQEEPVSHIIAALRENFWNSGVIAELIYKEAEDKNIPATEVIRQIRDAASNLKTGGLISPREIASHYAKKKGLRPDELDRISGEITQEENASYSIELWKEMRFRPVTKYTIDGMPHLFYEIADLKYQKYYLSSVNNPYNIDRADFDTYQKKGANQMIEINPEKDYYYLISEDLAVIVCERDSETKQYIVELHNFHTNFINRDLVQLSTLMTKEKSLQRAKALEEKTKMAGAPEYREALEIAPYKSTNTALVRPWHPGVIYGKLAGEKNDQYRERIARVVDPLTYRKLYEEFKHTYPYIGLKGIDMKGTMLFLSYYAGLTQEKQQEVIEICRAICKDGKLEELFEIEKFFDLFEICEVDWRLAEGILVIAKTGNRGKAITDYTRAILKLRKNFFYGERQTLKIGGSQIIFPDLRSMRMNRVQFYSAVMRKAAEFFTAASFLSASTKPRKNEVTSHSPEISEDEAVTGLQKKFPLSSIYWGAVFSSFTANFTGNLNETAEAIEEELKDCEIRVTTGQQGLIKNPENMDDPENYPHPGIFSHKIYKDITGLARETFQKIDPVLEQCIINNYPYNITNPQARFITVLNIDHAKKTYKVAGHVMISLLREKKNSLQNKNDDDIIEKNPEGKKFFTKPGVYYLGMHYVDKEFRFSFNFGKFLKIAALSIIPEGSIVAGVVSVANPALEAQIDDMAIGYKIVTLKDRKTGQETAELVEAGTYNGTYLSKNIEHYPNQKIIDIAEGRKTKDNLPNVKTIEIYKSDSTFGCNQEFINLMQEKFTEGYVLTRCFYGRNKENEPDMSQTYLAFEKICLEDRWEGEEK